jgi:hypothetical protein
VGIFKKCFREKRNSDRPAARGESLICIRARLHRLRKNSGFDFALKGRGFSRAVSLAKSMAALAADAPPSYQDDFFRSLFRRAVSAML